MSDNVTEQDVIEHLLIVTPYGNGIAEADSQFGIKLTLGGSMLGVASISGNVISLSYSGPPISDIQWV